MKQIMPRPNEMQLFHGTNANNTAAINQNGFNRIFAGINGKTHDLRPSRN